MISKGQELSILSLIILAYSHIIFSMPAQQLPLRDHVNEEQKQVNVRAPGHSNYHDFLVGKKRFDEDSYLAFLTGEKKSHGSKGDESAYWDFVSGDQWKKRSKVFSESNKSDTADNVGEFPEQDKSRGELSVTSDQDNTSYNKRSMD